MLTKSIPMTVPNGASFAASSEALTTPSTPNESNKLMNLMVQKLWQLLATARKEDERAARALAQLPIFTANPLNDDTVPSFPAAASSRARHDGHGQLGPFSNLFSVQMVTTSRPPPATLLSSELVLHVLTFLPLDDLLAVELVTKIWHEGVHACLTKVVATAPDVILLTFKVRHEDGASSPKQTVVRAWSARHKRRHVTDTPSGLYILGGTFQSEYSGGVVAEDPCGGSCLQPLQRSGLKSYMFSGDLDIGACAATVSSDGKIVMLGGWCEDAGEAGDGESMPTALKLKPVLEHDAEEDSDEEDGWAMDSAADLPRPVCFAAATTTVGGHLVVAGGSDTPYQGSVVYDACAVLRYAGGDSFTTQVRAQCAQYPWPPWLPSPHSRCYPPSSRGSRCRRWARRGAATAASPATMTASLQWGVTAARVSTCAARSASIGPPAADGCRCQTCCTGAAAPGQGSGRMALSTARGVALTARAGSRRLSGWTCAAKRGKPSLPWRTATATRPPRGPAPRVSTCPRAWTCTRATASAASRSPTWSVSTPARARGTRWTWLCRAHRRTWRAAAAAASTAACCGGRATACSLCCEYSVWDYMRWWAMIRGNTTLLKRP